MIYGYARVSTVHQERDGNSLESQTEKLRSQGCAVIITEAYYRIVHGQTQAV